MQVRISGGLRAAVSNKGTVNASGATIAEVLRCIDRDHAGFYDRVCDGRGRIRRFVRIFLNGGDVADSGALETPVGAKDEIEILQAVAGG
jgi:molybdopterin synthase sulfur carrier subunit